jgi:Na+/H+ antiporter NhaC
MDSSFSLLSLLPPILVLVLGYITHRVVLALCAGVVFAALLACQFAPIPAMQVIASTIWNNLELTTFFSKTDFWQTWNLFICVFLLALGIFVTMLQYSGGAYAYGVFAQRKIKNAKSAETSSLILSTGLFADDYLSSLTVGSVMYPLTDTQRIPRAKLAFLVDSMSAPLAILCPFSSWVAAMMGFLRENGVNEQVTANTLILANPLTAFIDIVPFVFYSFILIASMWFIVRKRISFGIMKKHEQIAQETGNLYGGAECCDKNNRLIDHNPQHTTLLEFFLPMGVLLLCVIGGILYSGNAVIFGGSNGIVTAFQQSSAAAGLFIGGNITVVICTIFFVMRRRITLNKIPEIYWQGIKLMAPAVLVLMLAWTFGDLLREKLHTGEYLASLMLGSVNITLLPVLLYFVATAISFTIGTSWGTAAMLFPIAIPLVLSMTHAPLHPTLSQIPMFYPVLGAVLSGCLAGNHVSPIADTTIMSSMSTRSRLKDHICTQIQYATPGILITGVAFWISGILVPYGFTIAIITSLVIAITLNLATLWLLDRNARS